MNYSWFLHKIKIEKHTAIKISTKYSQALLFHLNQPEGRYSLTHSWYPTWLYFTPQPFSVLSANHVSSFSLHFCECLLSETPEQPRFFPLNTLAKAIHWKRGIETGSQLINRLIFSHPQTPLPISPSLHPALLFLWPFYFTPIAVNPARSQGGILKAALLSALQYFFFALPSFSLTLMCTSRFIEVCRL